MLRPEPLIIRPPSEWRSMLIRSTRGCNWNRCKFCGIYPAMGQPDFSIRPLADVLADIDWYKREMPDFVSVFIGDADPLCRPVDESCAIISHIRKVHPHCIRITAYVRAGTIIKLGSSGILQLAKAGLTRIHMGLESGDTPTLKFHCKGQASALIKNASHLVKDNGIELSVYVLLGLGGALRWKEHCDNTAELLNEVNPDFIRLRRLWIYSNDVDKIGADSPLVKEVNEGRFDPQTPEGTVLELRRLIEYLDRCTGRLVCDHGNNYVTVEGRLPRDKQMMLNKIDGFLALSYTERNAVYDEVGSTI